LYWCEGVSVELDGVVYYLDEGLGVDRWCDNASFFDGVFVLCYGWLDVMVEFCRIVGEVVMLLVC